jgi:hypothetical protein
VFGGVGVVGGFWVGVGGKREITQTLYAYMNIIKKEKRKKKR